MEDISWNQYREKILNFLRSRVSDDELAKDLTQDIFVKVLQNQNRLEEIENLDNWIFTIARNRLIDHTRKKKEQVLEEKDVAGGRCNHKNNALELARSSRLVFKKWKTQRQNYLRNRCNPETN